MSSSPAPSASSRKSSFKAAKLQFTSNFTREPGGHFQRSVRNNDTGETRTVESRDGKEYSFDVTFSKNHNTVTTNGETQSWDDWAKSRGWESGNHAAATTSSATTSTTTKKDGSREQQTGRQKIRDPQVDPATVGFDASQL